MKRRLSAEEARDAALRRIAELEPRVTQLKATRRAATIAQRAAKLAYWEADIELRHLKAYVFTLAVHVANGDELVYADGDSKP